MSVVHLPQRPSWQCTCGNEWPCTYVMVTLENEFADSRVSLSLYLVGKWFDATQDLPDEDPHRLYTRIVSWPRR